MQNVTSIVGSLAVYLLWVMCDEMQYGVGRSAEYLLQGDEANGSESSNTARVEQFAHLYLYIVI